MKVSILDQTQLIEHENAEAEFNRTVELAQYLDEIGYTRYWLSEHHSTDALAGSAPEILASYLLAKTKKLRVGTGGVMLPHYSSYKVAEMFKVLSALAPGRIDLGVGRAPGGHHLSNIALQGEALSKRNLDHFPQQIDEILHYFKNEVPKESKLKGLLTTPNVKQVADFWVLGTSPSSALLAAQKGLPYVFAQFINYQPGGMERAIALYRKNFKPSEVLSEPKVIVTIKTILADTDEAANELAKSALRFNFYLHRGILTRLVSPSNALIEVKTDREKQEIEALKETYLIGSKDTVRKNVQYLKSKLDLDEIMTISPIYHFEDRKYSLKLLKEAIENI
ncbi:LLM class flavin-dependent oxidoreductase [Staphylococcus sp. GSSP0090]|nr:LLM class flavin-dependent oxidoreductase [Staphylococcus sp. GSSP0090]